MPIQHCRYRQENPWVVTWKSSTGCKLTRSFATEKEAVTFERVQAEIAAQEKAALRRRRAGRVAKRNRISVDTLLDSYFTLRTAIPSPSGSQAIMPRTSGRPSESVWPVSSASRIS